MARADLTPGENCVMARADLTPEGSSVMARADLTPGPSPKNGEGRKRERKIGHGSR
jgi:hypothetical protein